MRACILAVLCLVGCVQPSKVVGVACSTSADCSVGGVVGTCESTRFCSYPDASCAGGQRYSPGAGDGLGNTCLGGENPCGSIGQACCTGSVCGSNLECDGASMTCMCGGEGQTCCASDACATNLACDVAGGSTCECGTIDEPCCGGSTCDTGVTCSAGTCTAGVTQAVVGMGHACAIRTDNSVWCWGQDSKPYPVNSPGLLVPQLGSTLPRRVPLLSDVAALGSAEFSVCARKTDGTVWCWGHNEAGQLGDGTLISRRVPAQIMGLTNVTMIEGGRAHVCAVGSYQGTAGVWCWGRGGTGGRGTRTVNPDLGRLGNNDVVDQSAPVAVDLSAAASAGQTVRSLAVGGYHSCIVMSDDKVWCWGQNNSGELGNGTTVDSKVPVEVTLTGVTIPGGVTIAEVTCSAGNNYYGGSSCMRLSDGAVYCWGSGDGGQLGDNTVIDRSAPAAPVDVTALAGDPIVEIDSAMVSHCGRTQAGDVWCWGENKNGIVGNGLTDDADTLTPAKALDLTGAVQLDMSHRTACAVDAQNRLFCWGTNVRNPMLTQALRVYAPLEVVP